VHREPEWTWAGSSDIVARNAIPFRQRDNFGLVTRHCCPTFGYGDSPDARNDAVLDARGFPLWCGLQERGDTRPERESGEQGSCAVLSVARRKTDGAQPEF